MPHLSNLERTWEGLAKTDPLWAICTDPARRGNKWTTSEFFETGAQEVLTVFNHIHSRGISLDFRGRALDFGCGAGRLTQALAARFGQTVGIDISATMIDLAQRHSQFPDSCRYICSTSNTLPFGDSEFSFIYSSIVLQHIERRCAAMYIAEFLRVLKPEGVLVFQVADKRKAQYLVRFAGRIRAAMRRPLEAAGFLKGRMEVHCFGEAEIREVLAATRCRIEDVQITNSLERDFNGNLAYLPSEPREGYVGKQYSVIKEH